MQLQAYFPGKKHENNPPLPKYLPPNLARFMHWSIIDEFMSTYMQHIHE